MTSALLLDTLKASGKNYLVAKPYREFIAIDHQSAECWDTTPEDIVEKDRGSLPWFDFNEELEEVETSLLKGKTSIVRSDTSIFNRSTQTLSCGLYETHCVNGLMVSKGTINHPVYTSPWSKQLDFEKECLWLDRERGLKIKRKELQVTHQRIMCMQRAEIAEQLHMSEKNVERIGAKVRHILADYADKPLDNRHSFLKCLEEQGLLTFLVRRSDWFDQSNQITFTHIN